MGLATAIALAQADLRVALIASRKPYPDNRTTALLRGSVEFLQRIDVWDRCQDKAAALQTMRLVDDTRRLIRAPEVKFVADEIGLDAFGYNIANRELEVLSNTAHDLAMLSPIDEWRSRGPGAWNELIAFLDQAESLRAELDADGAAP